MGTLDMTLVALKLRLYRAIAVLKLSEPETIVGDDTYKSPDTYVVEVGAFGENFTYEGGSLTYDGTEDIEITIRSTITVSSSNAGVTIVMTSGKNGTPNTDYEIGNKLTTANDEKELTHQGRHLASTGDTFDFYVKCSSNIVLEKAVWFIDKVN